MDGLPPYDDEQVRISLNLEQHYDAWIGAARALADLPYGMHWKTISGREYLYELRDRAGNGKSLGPRNEETERVHAEYVEAKLLRKTLRDGAATTLDQTCRLYRAARLPLLASEGAKVLREADLRGLLGSHLLVVGTNAMPAYALESGGPIPAPDETDDFDVAWTSDRADRGRSPLWDMLQSVDSTYTVNTERTFQARNAKAHEIEILVAPSRAGAFERTDRPVPVPLPEQEWLLRGEPLSRVVVARDGSPARLVVPDPRWFALQKLWMSEKPGRATGKRPKDLRQGMALLDTVWQSMPQYPLDDAFEASLPEELAPHFNRWRDGATPSIPSWT